jgi:hypothetical protein
VISTPTKYRPHDRPGQASVFSSALRLLRPLREHVHVAAVGVRLLLGSTNPPARLVHCSVTNARAWRMVAAGVPWATSRSAARQAEAYTMAARRARAGSRPSSESRIGSGRSAGAGSPNSRQAPKRTAASNAISRAARAAVRPG